MKGVLDEGINTGEKDFSALVSKIKQSGADLIYWGGLYTEGGLIVRQMRDQGVKAPLMGGDGITSDEFASVGGPGVEGTLMTYGPDPRNKPGAKKVVDEFRAKKFEPEACSLQLCRRADYQASRRSRQVSRPQEGRRENAFRDAVQDGARRSRLRQERRYHQARLRNVRLEERPQRQDHVRRMPGIRLQQGQKGNATSSFSRKPAGCRLCEKSGAPVFRGLYCLAQDELCPEREWRR